MATGIDVVVVAFGAPELLDTCLGTLGAIYPVLVVDNSSDIDVRTVAERHGAGYIDPGANLGFAGGVNLGLAKRERSSAHVLLLNPDASITAEGVAQLVHCLQASEDLACVAPGQVDADGQSARVAWPFPTPLGAWIEALGLGSLRRREDFMIGSVLLIRSAALDQVGPFDERFFLYAEEADWQRRASRLAWRVALCREVNAVHVGAGTGGDPDRRDVLFHASQERYVRKHHGWLGWGVYRVAAMVGAMVRALALPGDRGRRAAARFRLYWRGPSAEGRRLGLLPDGEAPTRHDGPRPPTQLSVTHVVVTDAFAGVERYVCRVADELARRGHRVTAVGGDPWRMQAELDSRVAFRPARSLAQAALALGHRRGTDLVHVHMTTAEVAAWMARPVNRAPIIATRHFARERGSSAAARGITRLTSRALSRDVAISRFVAETVRGPTVLIHNGVPDRPATDLGSKTVLMMQRLDPEKSPDVGLRAWALSQLAGRGWRLVVAGVGHLGPDLARLTADLGISDSVRFAGQVEDTEHLLAKVSILLAPAPAEPFGLSVVEAMAHGVPVVAADGGAHRETLGEDGLLFPTGDPHAAAEALVALSRDVSLRRDIGARLRRRQQELFSLEHHVDELESLYRQVAGVAGTR